MTVLALYVSLLIKDISYLFILRSGSTYGMTLEVIKVSVSKALDTLGNDDYVMVAEVKHAES